MSPAPRSRELAVPVLLLALSLLGTTPLLSLDGARHSALWGKEGELWEPGGRLPDFSYAGYHRGEKPIPEIERGPSVKRFGAAGDGETDDTEAFLKAIEAGRGKVIHVPPGRYKITGILSIHHSETRLEGAGKDRSVLYFPTPLNEIAPNWGATTSGRRTSNYSWSGGFIQVKGSLSRKELARVVAPATRGDRVLRVSSAGAIRAGDLVRLELRDTGEDSLARHLYAGDPGALENLNGRSREVFVARVIRVEHEPAGKGGDEEARVTLDRALRTDVRAEWEPRIYPASSSVEEVGIEDLSFEFPETPYGGHFTEVGYNALAMSGVRNCWARGLRIRNADSGIFIHGVNTTLEDITIESDRKTERSRKATGHHGITLGGQDNLLRDFRILTRFMHDITVTRGSAGNVAVSGRGVDLALDHHRYAPHSNLFTDIDLGEGSRMFQSGGGRALGRHSGARETFWCIRARRPQEWPAGWGPDLMNLVGVPTDQEPVTDPDGRWLEAIDPRHLEPCNLYEAQLERRLEESRPAASSGAPPSG